MDLIATNYDDETKSGVQTLAVSESQYPVQDAAARTKLSSTVASLNQLLAKFTTSDAYTGKAATAGTADTAKACTGNSATATKLKTGVKLKVALASTTDISFTGASDQTNIPVSGILPAANGGTGQTTLKDASNALIKALDVDTSKTPVDGDYFVSQYANGGTTVTTYNRRPLSKLWEYIKGKISKDLGLTSANYGGKAATAGNADYATIAAQDGLGNVITDTYAKDETMKGATASTEGTKGLVPPPAAKEQKLFLRGDGTWATPTDTNTWDANTVDTAGYVSAPTKDNPFKVWGTNANGVPDWRENIAASTAKLTTGSGLFQTDTKQQTRIGTADFVSHLFGKLNAFSTDSSCYQVFTCNINDTLSNILQFSSNGKNYELSLSGAIIEFLGIYNSETAASHNFRLRIHSKRTDVSFTATAGYTKFPPNCVVEYNRIGADGTWSLLTDYKAGYTIGNKATVYPEVQILSNSSGYLRTPSSGLIPNTEDSTNGSSTVGTATWPFKTMYAKTFNGNLNGNVTGSRITVSSESDVTDTSYGTEPVSIGSSSSTNMGIDGNEIQARSGTSKSTLYLNHSLGGEVEIGSTSNTTTLTVHGSIVGALSGNATSATKATNDGNGKNIADTYATKASLANYANVYVGSSAPGYSETAKLWVVI